MYHTLCVLILVGCSLVAGCRESVKSSSIAVGSVTLNGEPLAGAEVQFIPTDSALGAHTTTTGVEGTFTLKAEAANTPVRPGSYVIVVNKWLAGDPSKAGGGMEGMKNEVPERYRAQATTPLKAEIKDGENSLGAFPLTSKR